MLLLHIFFMYKKLDFFRYKYIHVCSHLLYIGFTMNEFKEKFDAVWCSHCLEHQLDVNIFLKKIHDITKENGIVGITVPPLKHLIVGGHVSLWNAGLLLYNLVLAGFDCSESKIKSYDYNISVILRKRSIILPQLVFDRGDLVALRNFFPKDLQKDQWGHFDGQIQQLNWD